MKHGIVIKNSKIPKTLSIFINVYAITLWPFIIFSDDCNDETIINHERIHIAQQKELFVVFFYLLYVLFWTFNLLKYKDAKLAYSHIPFEREAYDKENEMFYILNRKSHAWTGYIK